MLAFLPSWKDIVAGSTGGVALVVAGHPLDTIKVRLQTMPKPAPGKQPQFKGAIDCFVKTLRNEGIQRGLYKGMLSPITGVPPIYALVFAGYSLGKQILQKEPGEKLGPGKLALAGAFSGIWTTAVTAPVELVKARLQVQINTKPVPGQVLFAGPLDCAKKVVRSEGIRGLYRGTLITLYRDVPASAAWFGTYELIKQSAIPAGGSVLDVSPFVLMFAGGMAGINNWLLCFPIDLIKSRIQTDLSGSRKSILTVYREVVTKDGYLGLYKGISPALLRAFPANAACFVTVEYTMRFLNNTF